MIAPAVAIPPHVEQTETTELFGRATLGKIGMWIFLLSDTASFVGLLLGYGMLRAASTTWRHPGEPELSIGLAAALTVVLIGSSVCMVMAFTAAVERKIGRMKLWLSVTMALGVLFLFGQYREYSGLIEEGLIFGHSAYSSSFYAITSFHGLHVFIGVVYMGFILARAQGGKYDGGDWSEVELVDLFWHFVDLVWIFVFTFLYLLPAAGG